MIFDHIDNISQLRAGEAPEGVPGLSELISYYGHMPDFNDCEVLSLLFHNKEVVIEIDGWEAYPNYEEDDKVVLKRHSLVTFNLRGVSIARVEEFSQQNRLNLLYLMRVDQGFQLILAAALGLDACFTCEEVEVAFHPADIALI